MLTFVLKDVDDAPLLLREPRELWEAEVDGATFENARREESHRVEVFVTDDRAARHAVTRSSGWKTVGA